MQYKNLIIFDMDMTLVTAHTPYLWFDFLDAKGLLTTADRQKREKLDQDYFNHCLDIIEAYHFDLSVMARIPVEEREQWSNEFFESYVKERISQKGLQIIEEYKQQESNFILLTTASLRIVALPVAQYIGMHDLIVTEAEVVNNQYTGQVLGMPNIGEGKVINLEQWLQAKNISPKHITFYSDSINDLPLLSRAHKAIAVDPDEKLKNVAIDKNWQIISLKNP
jgi:HAD superfamily hydrolase (TIGR01490 family)